MKYKNASDVLPDNLLKKVQKYAAGELLYFPKDSARKKWGEDSGARNFFQQRNAEIRQKYLQKTSIERLADEYSLSEETVRKIIFK
jgi:Mor family transcriptional regulator